MISKTRLALGVYTTFSDTPTSCGKSHCDNPDHVGMTGCYHPVGPSVRCIQGTTLTASGATLRELLRVLRTACSTWTASLSFGFIMWVCLKKWWKTPKTNGFADHYPVFKWLFHWED